jgi:adiponectin receptor
MHCLTKTSQILTLRHAKMCGFRLIRKKVTHVDQTAGKNQSITTQRFLRREELPEWYQGSHSAQSGFRPISGSWIKSAHSLTYLHNETLNVYTHLVPAIYLLLDQGFSTVITRKSHPRATLTALLILNGNVWSTATMMICSAAYHTLRNHSPRISMTALQADMTGAVILVLGDSFSQIYVDLYREPRLCSFYCLIVIALAVPALAVASHSRLQKPHHRNQRVAIVSIIALLRILPTAHGLSLLNGRQDCLRTGLTFWIYEGISYVIASVFFLSHAPESLIPHKFDIYFSSHQFFHLAVVIAAFIHLWGARATFEWNYTHLDSCNRAV